MVTASSTKKKKCPYCGQSFGVPDAFVKSYSDQEQARNAVQQFNNRL